MNFCGIICEFNPFHNGHKYIIDQAKEKTGLEIICLMSGNFVQRGTAAIESKYERAKKAVLCGATAVLELPTIYACSNAENFAFGSVKILNALGVTHLAFGIENTSLETLQKIAKLKFENSERFQTAFKNEIQNGINYNTSLKRSIAKNIDDKNIIEILNKPNNILAIEYLTAILKLGSKIKPVAIERCDNGFYSEENYNEFLSATSIRNKLYNNENIDKYIPKNAKITDFFSKNHINSLNMLQIYKIRQTSPIILNKLYDYSEGIEYRVEYCVKNYDTFDNMKSAIVTSRYREPRVNKLLLYPLLNITKKVIEISKKSKPAVKLLAINKNKKGLLRIYNKNKISIIVTNKDYENLSKTQIEIINVDLNASDIYQTIINKESNIDKKTGTLFI
ncbi:MAG: nucleotidyltransferase family protein [Clostridia bacterium]|nr:nucleotidyltransferase family protein [Clostridia bacterium]